ncbi:MAG: alanine--glyoxylate aminotransferase family protein [Candidatus Gastranaerophilales bacterium]|nr:alanine--glyoxylate aminotransferase family protein [Candidatus Gastranaerophilales bacterium]
MKDKLFLMIPGPTPVPESVLQATAKHPIGHRSSEFSSILKEVYADLKWFFQTQNDVYIFTASGTGAMDAALSNILNPNDKVLSLVMGNFGERWAKIAKTRGAEVETIDVPWGNAINPDTLKERLAKDVNKEIKVVTLTHNETSTGVMNDIETLCKIIKEHGALSVVDGVTSVGAVPVKTDEWGIDILVSGSQKGFMIPPGLSFLSCSQRAFEAYKNCKYPSFYFDFAAHKKSLEQDTTPFTPNVNLIFGLHKAFEMLKSEGLDAIHARHAKLAKGIRAAIRALGLKLLVEDDAIASRAITSILPPDGVSVPQIRSTLTKDYDIVVANGQGQFKDKIFRIGHLGFVSERDAITAIGALEATLLKLGYNFDSGSGISALIKSLAETKVTA